MKTKRKTWYLQKKDILYVEENHDGKYGAKGKERLPKRKLTPEDVQRVNAWNKSKRARLRLMEYFSPGDLWVTFTYKPEPKPEELKRWPKKVKPKKGYYIAELFEGKNPVTGYNYRHYTLIRLNRRI